jgi:hypothetical protein
VLALLLAVTQLATTSAASAQSADSGLSILLNLHLVGGDGVDLGSVNCLSIGNRATPYGSIVGSQSIWKIVSPYGSIVSQYSAYNIIASDPPALYDNDGHFIIYVSKNPMKVPRILPDLINSFLMKQCDRDEPYRSDD